MPALATASLDAAVSAANVEAADDLAADTGDWNVGMQMLSAVVGCAAVGTVLWSEFVLKDTGVRCWTVCIFLRVHVLAHCFLCCLVREFLVCERARQPTCKGLQYGCEC